MRDIGITDELRVIRNKYLLGEISLGYMENYLSDADYHTIVIETCVSDWNSLKIALEKQQAPEEETGPTPEEKDEAINDIRIAFLDGTLTSEDTNIKLVTWTKDWRQRNRILRDWGRIEGLSKEISIQRTKYAEVVDRLAGLDAESQQAPEEETGPTGEERRTAIEDIRHDFLAGTADYETTNVKLVGWYEHQIDRNRITDEWECIKRQREKLSDQSNRIAEAIERIANLDADNRRTRMLRALETVYGRIRFEADKVLNMVSPMVCNHEFNADKVNRATLDQMTSESAIAPMLESVKAIRVIIDAYNDANLATWRIEIAATNVSDFKPASQNIEDRAAKFGRHDPCDECERESPEDCAKCPWEPKPLANFEPASQNIEDTTSTPTHNPLCVVCLEPTREGCRNCTWYHR